MVQKNKCFNISEIHKHIDAETERMESKMLDKTSWFLGGEIEASKRYENSILDQHLDVQRHGLSKPHVKNSNMIEDFIKKCIKEQTYDSPSCKAPEVKKTEKSVLSNITSQKSLVEDYEAVFNRNKLLDEHQSDPVKSAIQEEMCNLLDDLDKISQLRFLPYKHSIENKMIINDNALTLEQVGSHVNSRSELLAPEEICAPRGEVIKGPSEITVTDRRRHRHKLKLLRSKSNRGLLNSKKEFDKQSLIKVIRKAKQPHSGIKIL